MVGQFEDLLNEEGVVRFEDQLEKEVEWLMLLKMLLAEKQSLDVPMTLCPQSNLHIK